MTTTTYTEYQAFRAYRLNGQKTELWAKSDADALARARKWARPAAQLLAVVHLTPYGTGEDCWARATERSIYESRQLTHQQNDPHCTCNDCMTAFDKQVTR